LQDLDDVLSFIRREFDDKVIFEFLYKEVANLFGEAAARQLVYKIMKEATKMAVKEAQEYVEKLIDPSKPCESFKLIYKTFGIEDVQCEHEGNKVRIKIKNCPLIERYDKERTGRACIVMMAIVAGMIDEIMGKKVYLKTPKVKFGHLNPDIVVEMKKSKVLGDEECEFLAEMVR